jgi:hypothetical protein
VGGGSDGRGDGGSISSRAQGRREQSRSSSAASDWLNGATLCEVVKGWEEDETTIEMVILALQRHQSQWAIFVLIGGDRVE